jgi:hypothetical protein
MLVLADYVLLGCNAVQPINVLPKRRWAYTGLQGGISYVIISFIVIPVRISNSATLTAACT